MPIITNFEDQIIRLMKGHQYGWFTTGVNLGGVTGVSGGTGGPIGGFTGQLIQSKVTFDLTENEIWTIPISGESLVTNLDRIRYRIAAVEGGGGGTGDTLIVQWDDAQVASGVIYLNFEGGVEVTDDGGSKVTVTVSGAGGTHDAVAIRGVSVVDWGPTVSGEVLIYDGNVWAPGTVGGGAITFLDLTDTPSDYTGYKGYSAVVNQAEDALEFTLVSGGAGGTFLGLGDTPSDYTGYGGYSAVVNIAEDGLEFIDVSGGAGGSYTFVYEDVTSQIPDGSDNFTLAATPASGSLVVHYDGITQQPNNYNIITGGFHTLFSPVNGEELTAEYYTDVPQGSILGLTLEVQDTDVTTATNVAILNFEGMSVTDEGSGKVTVSGGTGGGGASTLDELTDVVITSVANNELLAYDSGGNWINQTPSEAGLPTAFLDLSDVDEISYTGFEGYSVVVNAGEDGLEFVNVSGGGGGGGVADFTMWNPDAHPASPYSTISTSDDEFDDETYNGSLWTEYDPGGNQDVDEVAYGVTLLNTADNDNVQGIFQPVPSGISDWSITTYPMVLWDRDGGHRSGILLIEDITDLPNSECMLFANYRGSAGFGWQAIHMTDYNSWNADDINQVGVNSQPPMQYLRVRDDSTNWYLDWSIDGKSWQNNEDSYGARRWAPTGIGVGTKFDRSGQIGIFSFFRVRADSSKTQPLYGSRVDKWWSS